MENDFFIMDLFGKNPNQDASIYFFAHPEDADYYREIKACFLDLVNVDFYRTKSLSEDIEESILKEKLKTMKIAVIPITKNSLSKSCRAIDKDFKILRELNIPICPLVPKVFPSLSDYENSVFKYSQYVLISEEEKLIKYFVSIISNNSFKPMRNEFVASIFLSYRKRNGEEAIKLMKLIHKNSSYRDVSIWYDDQLSIGEDYTNEINEEIEKCDLVVLSITPSVLEEGNYVKEIEYPKAIALGKPIIAVEMANTDLECFKKEFPLIKNIIKLGDSESLDKALFNYLSSYIGNPNEDARHLYQIAEAYNYGMRVEVDREKAIELYQKAAHQDYVDAQFALGNCYRFGRGVEMDFDKAFVWYKKAAEQACTDAQFYLGDMYQNGLGVKKDIDQAIYWYKKAALKADKEALFALAYLFDEGEEVERNPEQAFCWYKMAAEAGLPAAQNNLGLCYEEGTGVEKDPKQAFYWYEKAAEQNFPDAQKNLGVYYEKGWGVDKNPELALFWYTKAAEQGVTNAQFLLGLCYEEGKGVEKNPKQAFYWYEKAAEQGWIIAQYCLGLCYEEGRGVEKNLDKAFLWFIKAAKQNFSIAQMKLGDLYFEGKKPSVLGETMKEDLQLFPDEFFQPEDEYYIELLSIGISSDQASRDKYYANGLAWYKKVAEQGDAEAQFKVGLCYDLGRGSLCDYDEAKKWYLYSARQGFAKAQYNINILMETGCGADNDKAYELYEDAKQREELDEAFFYLGLYYGDNRKTNKDFKQAIECFQKSIEFGESTSFYAHKSQYVLGLCFEMGLYVEKDFKKAFEYYKEAANGYLRSALRKVSDCYKYGIGVEKNVSLAISYSIGQIPPQENENK